MGDSDLKVIVSLSDWIHLEEMIAFGREQIRP